MIHQPTRIISPLIVSLILAACGDAAPTTPARPSPSRTPASATQAVAQASPIPPSSTPSSVPASTPSNVPANTPTPAGTPAPTLSPASSAAEIGAGPTVTPPFPEQQITADTLDRVELLRTVGFGQALHAAFSPDQSLLAVATSGGVAWYSLPELRHLRFDPIEGGANYIRFADSQTIEIIAVPLSGHHRVELRRVDDRSVIESRSDQHAAPDWSQTVDSPSGDIQARFMPLDSVPTPGVTIVRLADNATLYTDTETERVEFAAGGATVALVTAKGTVRIIDLLTDQRSEIALPGYSTAAFSPDGQQLVTAGRDLTFWDVVSGEQVQREPIAYNSAFGPRGTTQRILYSPDGSELTVDGAYAYFETEVRVGSTWTIGRGGAENAIDTTIGGSGILNHSTYVGAVSPAGRAGAFTSDGTMLEIHRAGALLHTLAWAAPISGLAFSPDGATLAVSDTQGNVSMVAVSDGSLGATFSAAGENPRFVFSPDSTLLAVGNEQGAVELITVGAGSVRAGVNVGTVVQFSFSPDGGLLAVRTDDGTITVIDVATAQVSAIIPASADAAPGNVGRLIFSADNSLLLDSHASDVRFYDLLTGRPTFTLPAAGDDIAIGPNRRLLLILRDGYVELWGIRE